MNLYLTTATPYKISTNDLKNIIKQLVILVDTREQKNQHITNYFDKNKIPYRVEKLEFCDYSFLLPPMPEYNLITDLYFHHSIAIERKASLEELSGNLSRGRETFENECMRARHVGCKVYLMIENPLGYAAIMNKQYRTDLTPTSYFATMKTFEQRYDLNVQFIPPDSAGYFIVSTFQYYLREYLK